MLGIADYLWRLIPGNPILRRVVENAGKKRRDMVIRCAYLGLLVAVVLYTLWLSGDDFGDLAALARQSTHLFQQMSYLQLGLVALLSPIFTAGAITQEKDSQTYDILLSTPLTNAQIVLGSLLSRVFFVVALLVSGIPIFAVTQIFGGVAINSIIASFLIAASTALVTGFNPFLALRVIFKDKAYMPPNVADLPEAYRTWPMSWVWTSPDTFYYSFMLFLSFAMMAPSVILLRRLAQSTSSLKGWFLQKIHLSRGDRSRRPRSVWHNPIAWREAKTKASAARATFLRYGFIVLGMTGAIVLLVWHSTELAPGKFINHSYDPMKNTLYIEGSGLPEMPVASGVDVKIGDNPATNDALNGRYQVNNYTQDANGAIATIDLDEFARKLSSDDAQSWLLGLTIVEFSVILLIISNAAASTVTREKEDGTLDLLLSTPITSRYYIWGKLRGLVAFVLPLIAVPVASAFIFVAHDFFRWIAQRDSSFDWIVFPEALITMPAMLIIACAFAAILGMQMSLRCRTTVRAVMSSVGIVVGACAAMGWCGYEILDSSSMSGAIAVAIGAFSPFTLLTILIDPRQYAGAAFQQGQSYDPATARIVTFVFCVIALGVYSMGIWSMYKSMVKNFDMTIRKQSR